MHSLTQLSLFRSFHGAEEGTEALDSEGAMLEVLLPKLAREEADKLFLVILKNPWPIISTIHPRTESST
jgi:hypothetical protein